MKSFSFFMIFLNALNVSAATTSFPDWLTDDKAKMWAVNQLVNFMKDDEFYKIKEIKIMRGVDSQLNVDSLRVELNFDDPKCQNRMVSIRTFAPLCTEVGCQLIVMLTDCIPTEGDIPSFQRFMYR